MHVGIYDATIFTIYVGPTAPCLKIGNLNPEPCAVLVSPRRGRPTKNIDGSGWYLRMHVHQRYLADYLVEFIYMPKYQWCRLRAGIGLGHRFLSYSVTIFTTLRFLTLVYIYSSVR